MTTQIEITNGIKRAAIMANISAGELIAQAIAEKLEAIEYAYYAPVIKAAQKRPTTAETLDKVINRMEGGERDTGRFGGVPCGILTRVKLEEMAAEKDITPDELTAALMGAKTVVPPVKPITIDDYPSETQNAIRREADRNGCTVQEVIDHALALLDDGKEVR